MNSRFSNVHVQRRTLLVAFYAFVLSLLNAKSILAIIFNIFSAFSLASLNHDEDSVVFVVNRVYRLYVEATPESREFIYLNVLFAALCCLLLVYATQEFRPAYYWPFFGLCFYKIFDCALELLESTMLIMHKIPQIRISQQGASIHLIMIVGVILIMILFLWAHILQITIRSKSSTERQLLDPITGLPCSYLPTLYLGPESVGQVANGAPPPFDWKVGEIPESTPAPPYQS